MKIIYGISASKGSYDDYIQWIEPILYSDKEIAEQKLEEFNNEIDRKTQQGLDIEAKYLNLYPDGDINFKELTEEQSKEYFLKWDYADLHKAHLNEFNLE